MNDVRLPKYRNDAALDPAAELRSNSDMQQARELARARAQVLDYVHLPKSPLPAMRWIAHVLSNAGRKGGLAC